MAATAERMRVYGYATAERQQAMAAAFDKVRLRPVIGFDYSEVRLICRQAKPLGPRQIALPALTP